MNHITRLINEREDLRATVRAATDMLTEIELYLTSSKFAADPIAITYTCEPTSCQKSRELGSL